RAHPSTSQPPSPLQETPAILGVMYIGGSCEHTLSSFVSVASGFAALLSAPRFVLRFSGNQQYGGTEGAGVADDQRWQQSFDTAGESQVWLHHRESFDDQRQSGPGVAAHGWFWGCRHRLLGVAYLS